MELGHHRAELPASEWAAAATQLGIRIRTFTMIGRQYSAMARYPHLAVWLSISRGGSASRGHGVRPECIRSLPLPEPSLEIR